MMVTDRAPRIGVLMGYGVRGVTAGDTANSPNHAGEAILSALRASGHDAHALFVDRDIDMVLRASNIDTAFVAVQGRFFSDGCLQGILETLAIPYTGSGVLASAIGMDRAKAREVMRLHNLPTAPSYVLDAHSVSAERVSELHAQFGFPVQVRPCGGGSTATGYMAADEAQLLEAIERVSHQDDRLLIERESEGPVITVAVLDGEPLGAIDRRALLSQNPSAQSRPRMSASRYQSILRLAARAATVIGAEGATLVDLVVSERMNEIINEIDIAPSLNPGGVFARIATQAGLKYSDLINELLLGARLHAHGHRQERRAVSVRSVGVERRAFSAMNASTVGAHQH